MGIILNKSTWQWEKKYLISGCIILIGGFFLLIFRLTHESVWFDESYTWAIINHTFIEIVQYTTIDVHPPLYYLLLKAFCLLGGNSIFSIRLFSILGVLALAALGLGPIRRTNGNKTGLLFSFLVFLTPINLSMAHEGRMYTWSAFFVTGTILYAYLAATGGKRSDWVKFGFLTLGAAYIHYYALLAVALIDSIIFVWLIRKDRRQVRPYLITMGLVSICYLPWIPVFINQMVLVKQNFWIPPMSLNSILDIFYYPFGEKFSYQAPGLFIFRPYAFWFTCTLILWGLRQTITKKRPERWLNLFIIAVYLLTIIVAIILSYLIRPILIGRYTMVVIGLLVLSLAIGLSYLTKKSIFVGAVILFSILSLPGIHQIYQYRFNGPMAEVASYLKSNSSVDPVFIYFDRQLLGPTCYYFPNYKHYVYQTTVDGNYNDSFFHQTSYGSDLDLFLKGHKNIWLVTGIGDISYDTTIAEITSKRRIVILPPQKFQLPYSWFKVSVSRLESYKL